MTQVSPEPYLEKVLPGLIPTAAPQPNVCLSCRSGTDPETSRCKQCSRLGVPRILPISMSTHGGLLHTHLRRYKDGSEQQRSTFTLRLAALLSLFVTNHLDCVGRGYDAVLRFRLMGSIWAR